MLRKMPRTILLVAMISTLFGLVSVGLPVHVGAARAGLDQNRCIRQRSNDCQRQQDGGNGSSNAVSGANTPAQSDACSGFSQVSGIDCSQGSNGGDAGKSVIGNAVQKIVKFLSYVAGILGIIFILLAGFRYITSGGNAERTGTAKKTLIYALIGLAVAALAQILIHSVLSTASNV